MPFEEKNFFPKDTEVDVMFLQEPRPWKLQENGQLAGIAFKAVMPWSVDDEELEELPPL